MKSKKKPYLTSQQLAEELEKSQKLGQPTIKVCEYFRLIANHLLGDSRYKRYPKDMQEDMASDALLKCIKNIKNFKPQYADFCFCYFTRCVEHSFWTTLAKHYRYMNNQRNLILDYAESMMPVFPKAAQQLIDAQITVEHNKDKLTFKGKKK